MKNKKKLCITIVVCLVVGIISGIAYFQVGKAAKKGNSQVVNESTTTKKDKGKTGKSLLNEINIKSYKDISKIVVGENSQEDVSWVEPIQTITFTNKDDIDYLYNQLSKLKTLNKNGADDENEVEAPKKRTIKIYGKKGLNILINYNPTRGSLIGNIYEKDKSVKTFAFENISEEFNNWLINQCDIQMKADYSEQYNRYQKMQKYVTALQKYEGESWYSGNEIARVDGDLKLKVFICRDNSENRKKILKIVDSPEDIVFGNREISYAKLKTVKEFISNQILHDREKYDYIIGCAVTSKEIKITMSAKVKKSQINDFLTEFEEYKNYINIVK